MTVTATVADLQQRLERLCTRLEKPVRLMEVCGTHTVSIFRHGLRSLLPANLKLVSGPGCPVCVTAQRHIDAVLELAEQPSVMITTYGDMLPVPGRRGNLEAQRARGADVRVVYSIRNALNLAEQHPDRQVVFIGVGFEATAPTTAAAIREAKAAKIDNFTVMLAHKLVVPAMLALLADGQAQLDGFLCPGHVSVIIGSNAYQPIVEQHGLPCVVAGFEPQGILAGLVEIAEQLADGRAEVANVYSAAVTPQGNRVAQQLLDAVFEPVTVPWRALGDIPASGLAFRPAYQSFDALTRFGLELGEDRDPPGCLCGQVIQGRAVPADCSFFGGTCTPRHPVGPCMVSSEGTCAAWFKYGQPAVRS